MDHPHNQHANVYRTLYVCRHLEEEPRLTAFWRPEPWITGRFLAVCGECSRAGDVFDLGLFGVCELCHFDASRHAAREEWLEGQRSGRVYRTRFI